jgi:hypothetical protein
MKPNSLCLKSTWNPLNFPHHPRRDWKPVKFPMIWWNWIQIKSPLNLLGSDHSPWRQFPAILDRRWSHRLGELSPLRRTIDSPILDRTSIEIPLKTQVVDWKRLVRTAMNRVSQEGFVQANVHRMTHIRIECVIFGVLIRVICLSHWGWRLARLIYA